ncbi:MAG: glycosyltransferase, partial [Bdellovibrionales bacterium]|nr:glycosyltransferase [Bdellovibrionales bacterium]
IASVSCKNRIIRAGYVPNSQLKRLYLGAVGFVFPSLYEGSSIAMLEAMKMGCPVLTSSVGATAELGRDSAHLVNPLKADQIFGGMERLAFDRSYRSKLVDSAKATTEKMTWLNCARETAAIFNRVYDK